MADYQEAPWANQTSPEQIPQERPVSSLAILGLIFAFLLAPLGFIFSLLALSDVKKENKRGKGLAIAGVILSVLNTIISILLTVFLLGGMYQVMSNAASYAPTSSASISSEEFYTQHPEISPDYCQALTSSQPANAEIFAQDLDRLAQSAPDQALADSLKQAAEYTRAGDFQALDDTMETLNPTLSKHEALCLQAPAA